MREGHDLRLVNVVGSEIALQLGASTALRGRFWCRFATTINTSKYRAFGLISPARRRRPIDAMNAWPLVWRLLSNVLSNVVEHLSIGVVAALVRLLVAEQILAQVIFGDVELVVWPVFDLPHYSIRLGLDALVALVPRVGACWH